MTVDGEQNPPPSSPRDGEDIAITLGQPKVSVMITGCSYSQAFVYEIQEDLFQW